MKYIKKYKKFLENFEINDSDDPDIKMSKEKLNDIKSKIDQYNSSKSKIDSLYNSSEDKNISIELENIVGKDQKRNDFLVSYANIVSLKKKIDNLKDKSDKKALELSEFKDRLSIASDETKKSISDKILEIQKQIREINNDILNKSKELPIITKQHEDKIKNIENDIKDWISKIQNNKK